MKHRKSLLISIWVIAIGGSLRISGSIIGDVGIIYHAGGWFTFGWYELIWVCYPGVGMAWSGIIAIVLEAFGIATTFIREYLDKGQKPTPPSLSQHQRQSMEYVNRTLNG